jgi:hypothetical protein
MRSRPENRRKKAFHPTVRAAIVASVAQSLACTIFETFRSTLFHHFYQVVVRTRGVDRLDML